MNSVDLPSTVASKVAPASSVAGEITFTVEGVVLLLVSLMMIVNVVTLIEYCWFFVLWLN